MKRYLILGSGIAGRRAAEIIRKQDPGGEVTIVEEQGDIIFARPLLGDLVTGNSSGDKFVKKDMEKLSKMGVNLLSGTKVTGLQVDEKHVILSNGDTISFDQLLLATGKRARRFPVTPEGISGIVYFDNISDIREINGLLGSVKTAVVVGASYQSLNALKGLQGRGVHCTLLLEEDRFWPGILDPVASDIMEEQLQQKRIRLIKGTSVQDILAEEGKLKAVLTETGENLPADLLVIGAPQICSLEYLKGSGLESGQCLPVDKSLRTVHDGIYAAGDMTTLPAEKAAGTLPGHGWLRAWRQGNIAGINMCGGSASYKWPPSLRTKIFDIDMVCIGFSDVAGEGIQDETGGFPYDEFPSIYKRLVFREGKLIGTVFLGDVSEAGAVDQWIRRGLSREECDQKVLDQMFSPNLREQVAQGVLCPVCKFHIQIDDRAREGSLVTCPACGIDFRLQAMQNGLFRANPEA